MTSHSAEDKAHWFLSAREVGVCVGGGRGGCQSNARTSERGRKMLSCRWIYCSGISVCLCVQKSPIYINLRQLGGSIGTLAVWVM